MSRGINLNFGFSNGDKSAEREVKTLNIALLADFGQESFAAPKAMSWGSLDDAIAELSPQVSIELEGQQVEIPLEELESLHPDEIYRHTAVFSTLRDLKKRLKDPATFAAAAAELGAVGTTQQSESAPAAAEDSLLEGLLGGKVDRKEDPVVAAHNTGENLISAIVAPYVIPKADPQLDMCLQMVDSAIVGMMKSILHHPEFQRVETLWRSIDLLLKRIEDEVAVKVYLVQADAASILSGAAESVLRDSHPNEWDLIIGDFLVRDESEDFKLLQVANKLATELSARFITSIKIPPAALDKESGNFEFFESVKALAATDLYGPGFLLRYPYGEKTDEIDCFGFEEWDNNFEHSDYLWGHGAFAAAVLSIDSFQSGGRSQPILGGLPVHVVDSQTTPCAEFWLVDRQLEKLRDLGISPLVSIRGRDSIEIHQGCKA